MMLISTIMRGVSCQLFYIYYLLLYCVRYRIIYRIHDQKDRNLAYNTDMEKSQR